MHNGECKCGSSFALFYILLPTNIGTHLCFHFVYNRSPVHPSIFATASSNGTLNIWNLASTVDQAVSGTEGIPIDSSNSSTSGGDSTMSSRQGLNRLQWSADGRRMAVASGDKLHVLGVGEEVWKSKGDEDGRVMHNLLSRGLIQEEE